MVRISRAVKRPVKSFAGAMALSAARGLARAARVVRPAVRPGVFAAPARFQAPPALATSVRPYISVAKYSRNDAVASLDNLYSEVLSANWADYLYLVFNVPFWELEYERVSTYVQPYLHEEEVGEKFHNLQELMDVLYECEDVRDHINELCEIHTRSSGIMGTGFLAGKPVDNLQENAEACSAAYDHLLKKHPSFKPKIEQTAGHGLAVLRAKHKFRFSSVYRYFY